MVIDYRENASVCCHLTLYSVLTLHIGEPDPTGSAPAAEL